jgi:uncharacterized protein YmfQ (DUF2313 family)
MSAHADLLKLLLPPVAYDKAGPVLSAEIEAEGKQLDEFEAFVQALQVEMDPRTATALMPDWERNHGLPDECRSEAETIIERRVRLAAKVAEVGGISKPYFLNLAASLGYENVSITSFKPTTCEMSCEAPLMEEDWRSAWRVNVPGQQNIHRFFTCESSCEDPVDSYKQGPLECLFIKLKPADSIVLFNYGESE